MPKIQFILELNQSEIDLALEAFLVVSEKVKQRLTAEGQDIKKAETLAAIETASIQPVQNTAQQPAVPVQQPAPQSQQVPAIPAQQPAVPVQQSAVPIQQTAPAATPQMPPAVPTAAQDYTIEQLAVAATQIMDAGRAQELRQLLASFGVPALTALPKEQYGAFATQLRAMGAKI